MKALKQRYLIAFLTLTFAIPVPGADFHDGIPSQYSAPLARALPFLHPSGAPWAMESPAVRLECYDTPGNRFFIGARQELRVHAKLQAVREVLDDFAHYPELFDGLVKAEVREKAGNRFVVVSEQDVPIPLVPNERNEVIYWVDESPSRVTYLYQLRKSNHLTANDGAIILEALSPSETAYLELDFWDADWGIAKTFAPDKIWRDNISGLVQADLAVKLKAEHPDWANPHVFDESKKELDAAEVSSCVGSRKPLALPKGTGK